MTFLDLTCRDAEDLIDGSPVPDRADLAPVRDLTVFMRVTREVEPAPPMSPALVLQIEAGTPPTN
jgi:hypothetical protein